MKLFFCILCLGFVVKEMVVIWMEYGVLSILWIVKKYVDDEFDVYIVLFFVNVILVLVFYWRDCS